MKKLKIVAGILGLYVLASISFHQFASAQDRNGWLGHMFFIQTNPEMRFRGFLKFQSQDGVTTYFKIGGTTGTRNYYQSLTPTASSTVSTWMYPSMNVQTFTVTGLTLTDALLVIPPTSASTNLCPLVSARASAADTLQLTFATLTVLPCTPTAGNYQIWAFGT